MRHHVAGRPLGLLGAILVALATATDAPGATSPPLGIAQLAARADLIVLGAVSTVQSQWNADRTLIETRVEVRVAATPKGAPHADVVSLWEAGGRVGPLAAEVADTPRFSAGERVLVFLRRGADGRFRVVERFQGKFSIERDGASGEELAVRRVPDTGRVIDVMPLHRLLAELGTGR